MKLITKLCALGAVTLACTVLAFAQTATTSPTVALSIRPQPGDALNGSVEISSSTVALANGIVSGSFAVTSQNGNMDTVYYGLVMRDHTSGQLIDVSPTFGKVSLVNNIPQTINVSYTLPNVYSTSTDVYLNVANNSGVSPATSLLGPVGTAATSSLCKVTDADATCTASNDSELAISVYDRAPQGELVGTTSLSLSAKQTVKINFDDLLKNFQAGNYVIAVTLSSSGDILDSFAKEYLKSGLVAAIVGTTMTHTGDAVWNATAYTDISGEDASSTFEISFVPSCGSPVKVPASPQGIQPAQLTLSCSSGYVTISLLQNGNEVNKVYQSFSLPAVPKKDMTTQILIGLASLIAIALGLVFYIVHKHHNALHAESTPIPGIEVMPPIPPVSSAPVQNVTPPVEQTPQPQTPEQTTTQPTA